MKPHSPQPTIYSSFRYDENLNLRISPLLWVVMFLGVRHIAVFLLHIFIPGLPLFGFWYELQDGYTLMISDALVSLVLIAAGTRLPTANDFWRKLWLQGRTILLIAFCIDIILFMNSHVSVLLKPEDYWFTPALAILITNVAAMVYLFRSTLVRDIFADFPRSTEIIGAKVKPLPIVEGTLGVLPAQSTSTEATILHSKGVEESEAGRLEESIVLIRKAIGLEPRNALFHRHVSELSRRLQRNSDAILFGRECVRLAPGEADNQYTLGLALIETNNTNEAIECFRLAIVADQWHLPSLNNLGVLLYESGDDAGAIQAFEQVLSVFPDHPDAKDNLHAILTASQASSSSDKLPTNGFA